MSERERERDVEIYGRKQNEQNKIDKPLTKRILCTLNSTNFMG